MKTKFTILCAFAAMKMIANPGVGSPVSIQGYTVTLPVSGTFTPSGPITCNQGTAGPAWPVTGTFFQATQPVSGTFFQATQPVSGSVSVSNFPASQAVTGTFFQATQPVSGTIAATQSGTWTVQPGNTANTTAWLVTSPAEATYSASILGLLSPLVATDIFTITGSATKTVRIDRIRVSATRTANGTIDISLVKRSTADTGGTSTAPTKVPYDSTDAAATAVVAAYTANPTLGTAVGVMRDQKMFVNTVGTGISDMVIFDFTQANSKFITLNAAAQQIAVNLNATTVTGGNFDIWVEWTEK